MTISSAVMRSSVLLDFRRASLNLGLDPIALMERVGIDVSYLKDPDLILPASTFIELLEVAAEVSGMDDFGLRFVEGRGLPDLGPVLLMMREEATVRDALHTLGELMHLHNGGICLRVEEDGDDPIVTIDILAGGDASPSRPIIDSTVASITHILRWLLRKEWSPTLVCVTFDRPRSRASYERFFHCPVDFQQEFNGIVLRASDLDARLPASSPAMRRQVERYIRTIDTASGDAYLHRVTQVVAMALSRGEAKADRVAGLLGTDRRTLNRRLAHVGQNFSGVVENVRKNVVVQHLIASHRPLSDIAGLVGFESLRAFSRWFHLSFKTTPSDWRRAHTGAARERAATPNR
jgi:AraC-like DNA-binding protein